MKKSSVIDEIKNRLGLLEKEAEGDKKKAKPKKPAARVDEEACPTCGSDLLYVEEGVVYCQNCREYFEYEEED